MTKFLRFVEYNAHEEETWNFYFVYDKKDLKKLTFIRKCLDMLYGNHRVCNQVGGVTRYRIPMGNKIMDEFEEEQVKFLVSTSDGGYMSRHHYVGKLDINKIYLSLRQCKYINHERSSFDKLNGVPYVKNYDKATDMMNNLFYKGKIRSYIFD